jgi:hypothetical protein
LHIRVLLARTSWDTSFTIFAFSFGERVVNHFASLCIHINTWKGDNRCRTYNFALSGEEDEVSTKVNNFGTSGDMRAYLMAIFRVTNYRRVDPDVSDDANDKYPYGMRG